MIRNLARTGSGEVARDVFKTVGRRPPHVLRRGAARSSESGTPTQDYQSQYTGPKPAGAPMPKFVDSTKVKPADFPKSKTR